MSAKPATTRKATLGDVEVGDIVFQFGSVVMDRVRPLGPQGRGRRRLGNDLMPAHTLTSAKGVQMSKPKANATTIKPSEIRAGDVIRDRGRGQAPARQLHR